jgi:hypothetical protein
MRSNLKELEDAVLAIPVPFTSRSSDNSTAIGGVITYGWLRTFNYIAIKQPWGSFIDFATTITNLLKYVRERDSTTKSFPLDISIVELVNSGPLPTCETACGCVTNGTESGKSYPYTEDATTTIECNDRPPISSSLKDLKDDVLEMQRLSKLGSEIWVFHRLACM